MYQNVIYISLISRGGGEGGGVEMVVVAVVVVVLSFRREIFLTSFK